MTTPSLDSSDVSPLAAERYHPRVAVDLRVTVHLPGRDVSVPARNLSMAGLFLQAHPGPAQTHLTVSIPLPGEVPLTARCEVRRRESAGVGLEFEKLDWDEMIALARYLHPRLP